MKPLRPLKPLAPRKKIKTPRVRSSSVESFSYDPKTKHLDVTFRGGNSYRYAGVDPGTHRALQNAESKGGFLHANIFGKFTHSKL